MMRIETRETEDDGQHSILTEKEKAALVELCK